jgi:hypothetical protein
MSKTHSFDTADIKRLTHREHQDDGQADIAVSGELHHAWTGMWSLRLSNA